jgi:molecular chaperone GrpE
MADIEEQRTVHGEAVEEAAAEQQVQESKPNGAAEAAEANGVVEESSPKGAERSVASEVVEEPEANEVAGDLDELLRTAAERDEYLALAQRTQADFENYRKRVARDSALAQERGVAKLAKELLPALDSLDRALDGAAADDPLREGVRLVREELTAALGRAGIEAFAPLGQTFDPAEHEAVAQAPVAGYAAGTVAEVYQTGYRTVGGNVIRPARVLVAA